MQNYLAHPDHQMILPNQDGQNGNGSSKFEGKALFIRYIHTYKKFSMSQIFLVDFEFHDFFFHLVVTDPNLLVNKTKKKSET